MRSWGNSRLSLETEKQQKFQWHLGITVTIALVLLAIIPVAVQSTLILRQVEALSVQRLIDQQKSQAEIKLNDLQRWLDNSQTTLVLTVANRDVRERMADILSSERELRTAITLQTQFFEEQLEAQDTFTEFFMFNTDGVIRATTDAVRINASIADQPYFQSIFRDDDAPHIQPPYFEEYADSIQMFVVLPIWNTDDQLVGGFGGRLNLDVLSSIFTTRIGLGETEETFIVSQDKKLVTPSLYAESYPIGTQIRSDGIEKALAGTNDEGDFINYRGVEVIGVYRWVELLNIVVVSQITEAEALAPIEESQLSVLVSAFVVIAIAVIIGLILTAWIVRPIRELSRVASAISRDDYSKRAPITRNNEIGLLAHNINQMADKLVTTINNLDTRLKELREATYKAEEAVRLKDEFLAVMSHELRTPLNASIGFLGLLKMSGQLSEHDLHMVYRARTNNERLLELINNILDISRIEAGRMNLMAEPFNLPKLLEKLYDEVGVLADQKKINLEIHIDDSVDEFFTADIDAMRKILSNLLSNAIKFTEKGKVRLAAHRQDDYLFIQVEDTGMGIPAHMIDTIFERFRQVDASSRRVHGGSGLGLSIVKNLTEAIGGEIMVESIVGKGSVFTLKIPYTKSD